MGFFEKILGFIKGINRRNNNNVVVQTAKQDYIFGSIISGSYTNYKHDPNPTILCLGTYPRSDGRWMVHGIQLHAAGSNLNYILNLIRQIKTSGMTTNPLAFYNLLKMNNYPLVKNCYRTYFIECCNFKTISPGFSNIPINYCVTPTDSRDYWVNSFNGIKVTPIVDENILKNSIIQAQNTTKVWD